MKSNSEKRHAIIFISKVFFSIDMVGNSTVHFFDVTHWYVQIWALEHKQHFLCYMIMVICHKSDIWFISNDTICYHELCQNHNKLNSTQPCCCYRYLHVKGIFSTERKIQSVVGSAFKQISDLEEVNMRTHLSQTIRVAA